MRVLLPLLLCSTLALAQAPAVPAPAPPPAKADATPEKPPVPPYFGVFGPEGLIKKTGFRTKPGRWAQYDVLSSESGGAPTATMRFQHVAPEVPGARWIEIITREFDKELFSLRMLTRGEKNNNIERMITIATGMPPIEFPMDTASFEFEDGPLPAGLDTSNLRVVGKEEITVKAGKFKATHWAMGAANAPGDYWTTEDPKVPFTGIVRFKSPESTLDLTSFGVDAVASVPVPPKPH